MGSDVRISDSNGEFIDIDNAKIVCKNISKTEQIYIGYSGDIKINDLLEGFKPPIIKSRTNIDNYIKNSFFKSLSKKLKEHNEDHEEKLDFEFLVFARGNLYEISNNLSVIKIPRNYHSIGSGKMAAIS